MLPLNSHKTESKEKQWEYFSMDGGALKGASIKKVFQLPCRVIKPNTQESSSQFVQNVIERALSHNHLF